MSTSLQGYGYEIHKRDGFKCQYCGADGTKSFDTWLTLSVDHLLPPKHPMKEEKKYKVTACRFCNEADNQYFIKAERDGYLFDNQSPDKLFERRKEAVLNRRQDYKQFWIERVILTQDT